MLSGRPTAGIPCVYQFSILNIFFFSPTKRGLVAAKFEADLQWYRAEVITFNTHVVKLRYIDFGNESSVPLSWVQPLESRHQGLPAQVNSVVAKQNVADTWSECTDVCDEILTQECIRVGCVPPACCPYLPACTAPGGTCPGGVPAWGCTCPGTPPPVDRQTRVKHNLRKLRLRAVTSVPMAVKHEICSEPHPAEICNMIYNTSNYHQIWLPNWKMSFVVSGIGEVFMNKIAL